MAIPPLIRTNRPGMPSGHNSRVVLTAAVLALVASPAWANPGTAMLWPIVTHFVFGNMIIGAAEWAGLCLFGASKRRAALMIPANYLSGYCGIMLADTVVPESMLAGPGVLSNIVPASILAIVAFTLIGIAVELPLVAISFRAPRRWKRVALACMAVNAVTSTGLAWYYHNHSDLSLARAFRVVPLEEMRTHDDAWIYTIAPNGQAVERTRPDGSERTLVAELPAVPPRLYNTHVGWSLSAVDADGDGRPDLMYHDRAGNFPIVPTPDYEPEDAEAAGDPRFKHSEGTWYSLIVASVGETAATQQPDPDPRHWLRLAADLRPEHERDPLVTEGLTDLELRFKDGRSEELSLLSPITGASTVPKAITALPGGLLVLELGTPDTPRSRGVFLADLHNRTIAFIGPGRSPVVVLGDPSE